MTTEMVWAPFDTAAVFQGMEVGESAQACCATCLPSTFTVQVGIPCAPPGQAITQFVPLTVSPDLGAVIATVRGGPLLTTTLTLALAVRPAASVSVTVIVWAPFENAFVFQGMEVGESAQACCATCVASTFTVQEGVP